MTQLARIRRDYIKPGDVVRSSHGYDLLITEVWDGATNRAEDRTVCLTGHLHANPARPLRCERYPANSLIEVISFAAKP